MGSKCYNHCLIFIQTDRPQNFYERRLVYRKSLVWKVKCPPKEVINNDSAIFDCHQIQVYSLNIWNFAVQRERIKNLGFRFTLQVPPLTWHRKWFSPGSTRWRQISGPLAACSSRCSRVCAPPIHSYPSCSKAWSTYFCSDHFWRYLDTSIYTSGHPPFLAETLPDLSDKIVNKDIPPLRVKGSRVVRKPSPHFQDLVEGLLKKNPTER